MTIREYCERGIVPEFVLKFWRILIERTLANCKEICPISENKRIKKKRLRDGRRV